MAAGDALYQLGRDRAAERIYRRVVARERELGESAAARAAPQEARDLYRSLVAEQPGVASYRASLSYHEAGRREPPGG